ncbi:FecCD family ABC transporter permease [Azospirillum argentinense]
MPSSTTGSPPRSRSTPSSPAAARRGEVPFALTLGGVAALLVAAVCVAFSNGAYPVPPGELAGLLAAKLGLGSAAVAPAVETVIWDIRGPRVLTAMLVGAGLAASGAAYQGLFRNPLISPDILGVSSGAALGAVLGIFASLPVLAIQGMAFAGGLLAVGVVLAVASAIRGRDPVLVLVLGGVVIGALLGSGVALLKYLADPYNQLPAITFWLLGSLSAVNRGDLAALVPPVVVALLPLVLLRWRLDVMTLGDEEATALGVPVRVVRIVVIVAATLMTAAAVSVSGIVGWVGLLVPHLARLMVGPAFVRLLPTAVLLGAAYLLAVDTLARSLGPVELPLGVLTAVIGTPVFLWLLAFGKRGWS